MNFGQAIEALKDGELVARKGWNGKGMWLHLVTLKETYARQLKMAAKGLKTLPYIEMKTADNELVPWLATQTDMLAEDWEIVTVVAG
ncbi:DUF2829 domain-containing protein [Paenibacillus popilliae]|uniref:Thoeris anti-defense 2-like domain-containing protein n=1 Tax=Paenibacillus popilliae ATCC 14706 TaxID=1212764 RepID=M9L9V4_PAEPP|nr:DUF2829 domain-containing protein [Paenibacillus popilliae]GAC42292.1 hypothetical protein PPOP_1649 [Paenibacillus popilliae ATCC 14706]